MRGQESDRGVVRPLGDATVNASSLLNLRLYFAARQAYLDTLLVSQFFEIAHRRLAEEPTEEEARRTKSSHHRIRSNPCLYSALRDKQQSELSTTKNHTGNI
jgi:hypothetical protein